MAAEGLVDFFMFPLVWANNEVEHHGRKYVLGQKTQPLNDQEVKKGVQWVTRYLGRLYASDSFPPAANHESFGILAHSFDLRPWVLMSFPYNWIPELETQPSTCE